MSFDLDCFFVDGPQFYITMLLSAYISISPFGTLTSLTYPPQPRALRIADSAATSTRVQTDTTLQDDRYPGSPGKADTSTGY